MKKFKEWSLLKEELHAKNCPFFNEREIWWCSLGENIGDEENGKNNKFLRPVLILRKFNKRICYAIPLSTKLKIHNPFYKKILFQEKEVSALISQMRLLDVRRFKVKMGKLSHLQFKKIKSSVTELF